MCYPQVYSILASQPFLAVHPVPLAARVEQGPVGATTQLFLKPLLLLEMLPYTLLRRGAHDGLFLYKAGNKEIMKQVMPYTQSKNKRNCSQGITKGTLPIYNKTLS